MAEVFSHMLWPLLASFVLVGIHAYLGIHIIARKVIFVDLALAQIAGLGAVYAVFIGFSLETDSWVIKAISVGFTLLGALLFAFTQKNDERVPHEAIIGIIYAGALSVTILLTANLPHGADEVQQMLAGNILWVTPEEVKTTALLYAGIGIIHIIFRRPFFALSRDISLGHPLSFKQRLWDFLFYATFGVVVTSSVGIGGVLLVFGYLVIPSVLAVILVQSALLRLIIAWTTGLIISTLGVISSYHLDLPSGPTIVVLLAALLIIVGIILSFMRSPRSALWPLGLLIAMIVLITLPFLWTRYSSSFKENQEALRHQLGHKAAHEGELDVAVRELLSSKDVQDNLEALTEIKEHRLTEFVNDVKPFLRHSDTAVRDQSVQLLAYLGNKEAISWLKEAFKLEKDEFIKIDIGDAIAVLGDKEGLFFLASIAKDADGELARADALVHLQALLNDAPDEPEKVLSFLNSHKDSLKFDEKARKFKSSF